jgi:rSAM/selenodomain-associated transferase 2
MTSVVIPAHNEGDNLEKLLPYLLEIGNGQEFEVIVSRSSACVDGPRPAETHKNVKFIQCDKKGRAVQMNRGASASGGNILAFLHADVWPPRTFFKDISTTLNENFEAGFFSYQFDRPGLLLKINSAFTARDSIFTGGGDQCLFIRRSVFKQLGGFDESQVLMEDFEFFGRMKKNGISYTIVKNNLIVSARKYQRNSYFRVNLSNLLLVMLFKLGYPPEKLKSLHNRFIRMPE